MRKADREPSPAGADVSDYASFPDPQVIHDLLGSLPRVAVGSLERSEVPRREQASVLALLGGRRGDQ